MLEKRSRQQVSSCPRLRKQQAVEDKTEMSWEGPLGSKRGLLFFFRKPGLKTSGTLGRKRLHKLKQKLQLGRGGSPTYTDTRISQLKGIVCTSKQPQSFSRTMDWTSEAMRQKKSSLLWVACHRYFFQRNEKLANPDTLEIYMGDYYMVLVLKTWLHLFLFIHLWWDSVSRLSQPYTSYVDGWPWTDSPNPLKC